MEPRLLIFLFKFFLCCVNTFDLVQLVFEIGNALGAAHYGVVLKFRVSHADFFKF